MYRSVESKGSSKKMEQTTDLVILEIKFLTKNKTRVPPEFMEHPNHTVVFSDAK